MNELSRRDLLKSGGMIAVGLTSPGWLASLAKASIFRNSGNAADENVLVVCQFSGGNDGLNMVVPYTDPLYRSLRPTIGLPDDKILKFNEQLAFHPKMSAMLDLYKQGKVAVIENVGYPQPNRSHFRSMDIWQSAVPETISRYGWIGRHFDEQMHRGNLNPVVALGLSTEKPLALAGKDCSIPCFASLNDINNMVGNAEQEQLLRDIQGMDAMQGSSTRIVQQASKSALDAMSTLKKQMAGYKSAATYDRDGFGNGFKQIAQLIATSPATRVIYFSAGGFDTHAKQLDSQDKLLGGFSNAVGTFMQEMTALGKADKVTVIVFSEFGRRVAENYSNGTDHGAASTMLAIGNKVKGGIYGGVPNLKDLADGDLKYNIDFRQVYAATLDQWMGGDSQSVLNGKFDHVALF